MSEEKPNSEPTEFERRYTAEKAQEAELQKERAYALFKVCQDTGLTMEQVDRWKSDPICALGIELIFVNRKPIIYRNITLGEYTKSAEAAQDVPALHKALTHLAVLFPKSTHASDYMAGPAGIPTTVAASLLRTSGFEEVVAIPV